MILLISTLLRVVANIASRPDIGLRTDLTDILQLGATLLDIGDGAQTELQALVDQIQTLVNEDRTFTDIERSALRAESNRLSNRLQELARERSGDDAAS